MEFLFVAGLAGLSLLAISLQRTFTQVPVRELRRRARDGDRLAAALYTAAVYDRSLRFLLWVLVGLTSAAFFVFLARSEPVWFAFVASAALIWIGFVWLSASQASTISERTASVLAPVLAFVLSVLHPVTDFMIRVAQRHSRRVRHSGLYEKADLLDLLDRQEEQPDNRISRQEIEIVRGALLFGDRLVGDVMTPRRAVRTVKADDHLGPVLMSELHDSGHARFPVFDRRRDKLVGTLYLRDLVNAKAGGKVEDKMESRLFYLHEDQTLADALQAILKTRHHLFVVVNSFEEYVGIITLEDVIGQIIGSPIGDEFDEYDDRRLVARRAAEKEPADRTAPNKPNKAGASRKTDPEPAIDK